MSLVSTCVYVIRACILIPIYCILYSCTQSASELDGDGGRRSDIRRVMLALFALLFFVVLFLMLFPLVFFTPIVLVLFSSLSLAPIVVLVRSGSARTTLLRLPSVTSSPHASARASCSSRCRSTACGGSRFSTLLLPVLLPHRIALDEPIVRVDGRDYSIELVGHRHARGVAPGTSCFGL